MIKELLLLFAVFAIFFASSCTSVPEKQTPQKATSTVSREVTRDHDEADSEPPEYKSPFFKDEDQENYYENEDEDDSVANEWFIDGLKSFWDFVTYPGRVIHRWNKR